jgi:hypothetical protein
MEAAPESPCHERATVEEAVVKQVIFGGFCCKERKLLLDLRYGTCTVLLATLRKTCALA